MANFRRAQLRGSDELFRPTRPQDAQRTAVAPGVTRVEETVELEVTTVVAPSPGAAPHSGHLVRLDADEIGVLAEALQSLKFPHKVNNRPSVDDFERLEELRQKLLGFIEA